MPKWNYDVFIKVVEIGINKFYCMRMVSLDGLLPKEEFLYEHISSSQEHCYRSILETLYDRHNIEDESRFKVRFMTDES